MSDPTEEWVIHPYYTGRDKGPLMRRNPNWKTEGGATHLDVLTFPTEAAAWEHIHTVVQPNDPRADYNYRVYTLKED